MLTKTVPCPCGSGDEYSSCCERYIKSLEYAPTAESLMRSRYSAYTFSDEAYLLASWHPSTRPTVLHLDETPSTKWLSLKIKSIEFGSVADSEGVVEFIVCYKVNGKAERLHERSHFVKENEQWFYVDGDLG